MPIKETALRTLARAKPPAAPYKLADAGGLYLYITTAGSLLWRYDYRRRSDGKRKTASFGSYPDVELTRARMLHQAAKLDVKAGGDPAAIVKSEKIKAAGGGTFGGVADDWLKTRTGKAGKTGDRDARMAGYLKAEFGGVMVDQVRLLHLTPLLKKYADKQPTRIRLQSTAKKIMGFAKAHGLIEQSPFSDINFADGYAEHRQAPRPAITDPKKFGALMRKIDAYEGRGDNLTGYALSLLALTFVRPGTVQRAEWKDFDLKSVVWTIPFAQLKMASQRKKASNAERDHIVPLSRQALALLRELHALTGESRFLFPGRQADRTMSENTLNVALIALGYKDVHCAHGFRSSASTILNRERVSGRRRFEQSLIEFQLDHQDQSTRAIYDRDDCLPERVELMQFWADKIDELRDEGKVTKVTKLHAEKRGLIYYG